MIEISHTEVSGWQAAVRGMRNPLNSWDLSDTFFSTETPYFQLGANDLRLMKTLVAAGPDHAKFLRFLTVTADINAPMYWWKEFDTYKVGTVRLSCSTMHRIHSKELTLKDFSTEHLGQAAVKLLDDTIWGINDYRKRFLRSDNKEDWWQMIQLLPSSYMQRSTVQLNYQVLRNIYNARRNHKLDEWCMFCIWIKGLPHSELITLQEK